MAIFVSSRVHRSAGATHAFAQGQNGILTGTVVDADGVVPGATVIATDPGTGLDSLSVVQRTGHFSPSLAAPGRYSVKVEMEGFRQITMNDVLLLSGETRDLGKLVLEVGTLTEAVTVTAEVTPVQYDEPARSREASRAISSR